MLQKSEYFNLFQLTAGLNAPYATEVFLKEKKYSDLP